MKLDAIINKFKMEKLTPIDISNIEIRQGLVGDLLSYILSKGSSDTIWVTIQRHINIVAVASSVEIPVIVISDNIQPEQKVIDAALENEIALLKTSHDAFTISGMIYNLLNEDL